MRIGIDISQLAYRETGVANYLQKLVEELINLDKKNEYILFYSSLRRNFQFSSINFQSNPNVSIKHFRFPPTLLDLLWNRLHIMPIEDLIGKVDVFLSSDWTQPPTRNAKKVTILYDLIVYKYRRETDKKIIDTQKRRLNWVSKECNVVFCISESTKRDAIDILGINKDKLKIAYPGI